METTSQVNAGQLKAFIERIEHVESEIDDLKVDKKDIYSEAKSSGFDVKIIRKVVAIRKQDADKRAEEEALLDLYLHSLGMLSDLPLGQAAVERAFPRRVA
jgi:uncharacterized protein (UPF0335 family)